MRRLLLGLGVSFALACLTSPAAIQAASTSDRGDRAPAAAKKDRSVGRVISDVAITTQVKSALIDDDQIKARKINVDTMKGVVHLRGAVKSKAEERRAIALAKKVDGVKRVRSHLKVARGASRSSKSAARKM